MNLEQEDKEEKGDRHSFFTTLTKKTKSYMHQLLNTAEDDKKGLAPLKWENFVKVKFAYSCALQLAHNV